MSAVHNFQGLRLGRLFLGNRQWSEPFKKKLILPKAGNLLEAGHYAHEG